MIAAFLDGEVIGDVSVNGNGKCYKICHRASMGIAVRKPFWNRRSGGILIREAIACARDMGFTQLGPGVSADNGKARRLYWKYGSEKWGVIRKAFRLKDKTWGDEMLMGLFL